MGSIYRRKNRYWIKYLDRETEKLVRCSAGSSRMEALAARCLRPEHHGAHDEERVRLTGEGRADHSPGGRLCRHRRHSVLRPEVTDLASSPSAA